MKCETVVLQPFGVKSHETMLNDLFKQPWTEILVCSAYALRSGVYEISSSLKAAAAKKTIVVGIGNGVTTEEGVTELLSTGADISGIRGVSGISIFHPKLCLVRSRKKARLLIGSSNLTFAALNNNVEASAIIDFDLNLPDDVRALAGIDRDVLSCLKAGAPFTNQIRNITEVARLRSLGLLESEATVTGWLFGREPRKVGQG